MTIHFNWIDMAKFIFHINKRNDKFELVDDWGEWISAKNKFDAQRQIEKAYPYSKGYECILTDIEE